MIQLVLLSINSIYSESGKVRANLDHELCTRTRRGIVDGGYTCITSCTPLSEFIVVRKSLTRRRSLNTGNFDSEVTCTKSSLNRAPELNTTIYPPRPVHSGWMMAPISHGHPTFTMI